MKKTTSSLNSSESVVDFRLAYRLSRKHDLAFLKSISKDSDLELVLLSDQVKTWLSTQQCEAFDIISKLHILLELDKQENKRHFGFQIRGQAMAFQIVYIDRSAWKKRVYRERSTGENVQKVQRMLHLILFDEIHLSKTQRLQIVKDMMLDHQPADEMA